MRREGVRSGYLKMTADVGGSRIEEDRGHPSLDNDQDHPGASHSVRCAPACEDVGSGDWRACRTPNRHLPAP